MYQEQSVFSSESHVNLGLNVHPSMARQLSVLLTYVENSQVLTASELRKLRERGDIGSSRRSNPNDQATHNESHATKLAIDEKTRENVSKAMFLIDLILSGWDGTCFDENCINWEERKILSDARIFTAYSPYCIDCATKREVQEKKLGK